MSWSDSIFKFFGFARYNTVAPTPAAGEAVELQADAQGRLLVAIGGAAYDGASALRVTLDPSAIVWSSAAVNKSDTIKATAGTAYELVATNGGAATWLHVTAGSDYLYPPVRLAADATVVLSWPGGRPFASNFAWAARVGAAPADILDAGAMLYTSSKRR